MTKQVNDEKLMALADGELPEAEARALQSRIRTDPVLAVRFEVFVRTRRALAEALDPGPVPDYLVKTIQDTPVGNPRAATVTPFRSRPIITGSRWGLALAASLFLTVGLGGFELGRRLAPMTAAPDSIAAVRTISEIPTGREITLATGGVARVLGSFDTAVGFCRLIALADGSETHERIVACRTNDSWRVMLSVAIDGADTYLPASDTAVGLVDDLLDSLGAGPALELDEELSRLRNVESR